MIIQPPSDVGPINIYKKINGKKISKEVDKEIAEENQQQETLRILLEQKKIAEEIRAKIEEENNIDAVTNQI